MGLPEEARANGQLHPHAPLCQLGAVEEDIVVAPYGLRIDKEEVWLVWGPASPGSPPTASVCQPLKPMPGLTGSVIGVGWGVEDPEFPEVLSHWSCLKAPKSFSEVSPGPGGSHFSSVKTLISPVFLQGNPLSTEEGGWNQFFPTLSLPLWSSTRTGMGDPADSLRNVHPRC